MFITISMALESIVNRVYRALEEICNVCVFSCVYMFVAYGSTTQFIRAKNQGKLIHKTYSNIEHWNKTKLDQQQI